GTVFVHLFGSFELIASRVNRRTHEYMPPALLESQFDTLEPLGADEAGIALDVAASPGAIVDAAVAYLRAGTHSHAASQSAEAALAAGRAGTGDRARRRPHRWARRRPGHAPGRRRFGPQRRDRTEHPGSARDPHRDGGRRRRRPARAFASGRV